MNLLLLLLFGRRDLKGIADEKRSAVVGLLLLLRLDDDDEVEGLGAFLDELILRARGEGVNDFCLFMFYWKFSDWFVKDGVNYMRHFGPYSYKVS